MTDAFSLIELTQAFTHSSYKGYTFLNVIPICIVRQILYGFNGHFFYCHIISLTLHLALRQHEKQRPLDGSSRGRFFSGNVWESNPPETLPPHNGFEVRGRHQATVHSREIMYKNRLLKSSKLHSQKIFRRPAQSRITTSSTQKAQSPSSMARRIKSCSAEGVSLGRRSGRPIRPRPCPLPRTRETES